MEDFRQITRVADIYGHQRREIDQPHRLLGLQVYPRRILLSLTVVTCVAVGMIAWWVQ